LRTHRERDGGQARTFSSLCYLTGIGIDYCLSSGLTRCVPEPRLIADDNSHLQQDSKQDGDQGQAQRKLDGCLPAVSEELRRGGKTVHPCAR
jgi:hypothetical protein